MSEATRVEQSIEDAERIQFDLAQLIRGAGQAYAQAFPRVRIATTVPDTPCPLNGAADLIAQMLDKLLDNAVGFVSSGGEISIQLTREPRGYSLSVSNAGPPLPSELEATLFESMVSARAAEDGRPHLGLGLYIVRLIAEFHGGRAIARNLDGASGVIVAVELPNDPTANN